MTEVYRVPVLEGDRICADAALSLTALAFRIPVEEMTRRERIRLRACRARWSAMYLAHVSFGWPLERVAHAFGLNRATASTACRWAEDERDRADYDHLMEGLEKALKRLLELPRVDLAPDTAPKGYR
ncbi:chromosomal replication initiator DnaA [Brevundimonas sp. BH3]|uniref:chromosomal replication initiator DnaA n=1 Tax=unclassified Brevundimonas TaxID=2622653 RepID=UPI00289630AA|nr:chromosomal replication initiator DnaA [Brevundimonas sp.]